MLNELGAPPQPEEFEFTLIGPGYGESAVMHLGEGSWVVVDSCIGKDGTPVALEYLESVGVDSKGSIELIVATHWHDDHIRGMERILESNPDAAFWTSGAYCKDEFLARIGALEANPVSDLGSGAREMYRVVSRLISRNKRPNYAIANRRIFKTKDCEVWALSPSDDAFDKFIRSLAYTFPRLGEMKTRVAYLSPNEAAIVLWIKCGSFAVLLGSDLVKSEWKTILTDTAPPGQKASLFKIPHHGSENSNEPDVWREMLEVSPHAVLTPWRRGGRHLPSDIDVQRILNATPHAWISNDVRSISKELKLANRAVARTLDEIGASISTRSEVKGMLRLRKYLDSSDQWRIETFGGACHLNVYGV